MLLYVMVKNSVLLLLLGLNILSCGSAPEVSVDPTLRPYVQRFFDDARLEHVNIAMTESLTVGWGDLSKFNGFDGGKVLAQCERNMFSRSITMDYSMNKAEDIYKEIVMLHELGHCILNRNHLELLMPNGNPASLMYPVELFSDTYMNDKAYYVHELFHPISL